MRYAYQSEIQLQIFREFDVQKRGFIDIEDLKHALRNMHESISDAAI